MSDWQPIETAPKDGTVIDLWDATTEMRACDSYWDQYRGVWKDTSGNYHTLLDCFTHWMPLPEPPK